MIKILKNILKKESGVSSMEYGIIASLIAVAALGSVAFLGQNEKNLFCTINRVASLSVHSSAVNCPDIFGDVYDYKNADNGYVGCGSVCIGNATSIDSNLLEAINAKSKIVKFSGLFNPDGTPATTFAQAESILNLPVNGETGLDRGTENVKTVSGQNYIAEVQTSDHQSYGIFWDGGNMQYRNLNTGATYTQDIHTGDIIENGTTST